METPRAKFSLLFKPQLAYLTPPQCRGTLQGLFPVSTKSTPVTQVCMESLCAYSAFFTLVPVLSKPSFPMSTAKKRPLHIFPLA